MRVSITFLLVLLSAAFIAAGCGGPEDPDTRLAEGCERQIKEIEEAADEGDTPVAKSTKEAEEGEELVECAGQESIQAAEGGEAAEDGAEGETSTEKKAEGEGAEGTPVALDPEARETFATTCGACHELSDAKTTGAVGPSLDDTQLDAEAIAAQIENGGGGMPPKLLEGDDAAAVAAYVAAASAAGE